MAFLKDFVLWPCEFCVLILGCVAGFRWPRIGVPEALGGSYVGRITCTSVDFFDVVRCRILFLPPLC